MKRSQSFDSLLDTMLRWNLQFSGGGVDDSEREFVGELASLLLDYVLRRRRESATSPERAVFENGIAVSALGHVGSDKALRSLRRARSYWRDEGNSHALFDTCFELLAFPLERSRALREMLPLEVDHVRKVRRDFVIMGALEREASLALSDRATALLARDILRVDWKASKLSARRRIRELAALAGHSPAASATEMG